MTSESAMPGVDPAPQADGSVFELSACRTSVSEARHRVRAYLSSRGCGEDACETAALLVSELATNALRHTVSPTFVCSVRRGEGRIHVAVEDHGGGVGEGPHLRVTGTTEVSGRGLLLVDELCEEWGVTPGRGGTGRVVRAVFLDV